MRNAYSVSQNSSVAEILATARTAPASAMIYVKQQLSKRGVGLKPIALTVWNIQAVGSGQDVSFIAGIHTAKALDSIMENQFGEASRWDLANRWNNGDDQGMFNVGDEPNAPLWNPRPSFFYLYYFQKFFGDRMVSDTLKTAIPDLTAYSSSFSSGHASTMVVNSGVNTHIMDINFQHFPARRRYDWYVLTGGTDNGNFSRQVYVNGTGSATATGGPMNYSTIKAYTSPLSGTIKLSVPPLSVAYLVADAK